MSKQSTITDYTPFAPLAQQAAAFLSQATDPYHAVHFSVHKLHQAGFTALPNASLRDQNLQPGGKYYYVCHSSTLVAFCVGARYVGPGGGGGGFHVIGGHTDSPNLRVKPRSKKPAKNGTIQLGTSCYGGGLWYTWIDKDLSISGKVLVRENNGQIISRLVQLRDPVARVSSLCIHLQTAKEREALKLNNEDHLCPIVGMDTTNGGGNGNNDDKEKLEKAVTDQINGGDRDDDSWRDQQEPLLLQRIAQELQIETNQIADFDLSLYDTQPAALGGFHHEFLYSARLDNLATVFCAVEALIQHANTSLAHSADIAMTCLFDHEEVGSVSNVGAGSPVMAEAMQRVSAALMRDGGGVISPDVYADTIAKSFCLSIDQAHAIHPNYASKHEAQHAPLLNHGVVIKTNLNQRYATSSLTAFVVRELAKTAKVPIQEFVVRNDCPCGSTIGPTISAHTGLRVVDAGMPQLSMHSCREVMGVADLQHGLDLFVTFFGHFRALDDSIVE